MKARLLLLSAINGIIGLNNGMEVVDNDKQKAQSIYEVFGPGEKFNKLDRELKNLVFQHYMPEKWLPHSNLEHNSVTSASFSPDGTKIVTASANKTVRLWDLEGNVLTEIRDLKSNDKVLTQNDKDWASSAVFSPDGTKILTASCDKTACLWNLEGKKLAYMKHYDSVISANFSSDGTKILTASMDETARLWDLEGNQLIRKNH